MYVKKNHHLGFHHRTFAFFLFVSFLAISEKKAWEHNPAFEESGFSFHHCFHPTVFQTKVFYKKNRSWWFKPWPFWDGEWKRDLLPTFGDKVGSLTWRKSGETSLGLPNSHHLHPQSLTFSPLKNLLVGRWSGFLLGWLIVRGELLNFQGVSLTSLFFLQSFEEK